MDEPTSGLDPVGRCLVRDIIHELRTVGTCVFLNSHVLSEIEVTCDRVAFIRHGEIVRTLDLASLEKDMSLVKIRATNLTPETINGLQQWGRNIQVEGEHLMMTINTESNLPEITNDLVEHGVAVYALTPSRMSWEDIFIETVGKDGGL